MSKLLSAPSSLIKLIENPVISSNFRTTTWIIIGGLLFPLLSTLLTTRITFFLSFLVILTRLIPTILVTTGTLPNDQLLSTVQRGRTAAMFPANDGTSTIDPASKGLALLILGVKITHPLGFFAPGAKQTGDHFTNLVADLNAHPTQHGWISGSVVQGIPDSSSSSSGHLTLIGYFKSMDALHRFAHGEMHREAWNWWNSNVKGMPYIGVYHEAYDVPAKSWEGIYLQTPKLGLGAGRVEVDDGTWRDMLVEAKGGVWKSSEGRMGRGEK
ncbi:hypothetical protein EG327_003813 [Venturia inaequalis]|uniref:Monooxygenase n=1 Tax=Venturia inaequalis TaxID=5025 RepID=A0A8H3VGS0_VENIN|nr:hypothetical protein EG327_003813 [Venturia inaequalis]